MYECTDKLILETILQDKFSYFKAEEGGVAVATATDDNAEIRKFRRKIVREINLLAHLLDSVKFPL